jgi:hypothetical protein
VILSHEGGFVFLGFGSAFRKVFGSLKFQLPAEFIFIVIKYEVLC